MPFEVRAPQLGESVVEASIGKWLKRVGDPVSAGETLIEIETDKVNIEVAAESAGVLTRIDRQEGDTIQPGDLLGLVTVDAVPKTGSEPTAVAAPKPDAPTEPPSAPLAPVDQPAPSGPGESAAGQAPPRQSLPAAAAKESPDKSTDWRPTAPSVRQLAAERGVEISGIAGTGRSGRVTLGDVARAATAPGTMSPEAEEPHTPAAPAEPAAPGAPQTTSAGLTSSSTSSSESEDAADDEERVHLSRRRLTIALRLVEAQRTTASLTTFNEMDMSAVLELRKRRGEAFRERNGVKLGFTSFFTKAAIGALKAYPWVNSELQGEELVIKRHYDVGIAVSAEGGLVVPVIRDADRKSFAAIEREVEQLARKAREGKLSLDDLLGGTFTITNGGVFGSLLSTPILNAPQVAILGLHKIQERPVAVGGQVVIRPMMYVALTYDHRVIDGHEAVLYLVKVKELIEDPEALLLEG